MNTGIDLWIDHRKAVIVIVSDEGQVVREITSHMERHTRFSSGGSEDGSSEDVRDRQFGNYLNDYYDRVIAAIRDGDSIGIFGPGEAKGELEKRFESEGLKGHIVGIETPDKMTDRQIAAKVGQRLLACGARPPRQDYPNETFASLLRSTPPQTGQQDAHGTLATYWSLPPEQLLSALHTTGSGLSPADIEPDEVQMGMPVEMVTRRLNWTPGTWRVNRRPRPCSAQFRRNSAPPPSSKPWRRISGTISSIASNWISSIARR